MAIEEVEGNGIQSLELGIDILKKIAEAGRPLNITQIATLCEMSKSKLHRYLTSFTRTGFLRKGEDLRYTLGTELHLLGLKAAEQVNVTEIAVPYLLELKETLNHSVALAIWGEKGPFFVRWEASDRLIHVGIKVGTQLNVTSSATGLVFASFLPADRTEKLIQQELESSTTSLDWLIEEIEKVSHRGYGVTDGMFLPGVSAISCPIWDQSGNLVAAITIAGLIGVLDTKEGSRDIQIVKQKSQELSKELGWNGS